MNLLFDLITPQYFVGGGAEYIRRVFYTLMDRLNDSNIELCALVDSSINKWAYSDLTPQKLEEKGLVIADISNTTLETIVKEFKIDKFFMGCAQYMNRYDIENVKCPVVCVIHDLDAEEFERNSLEDYVHFNSFYHYLRWKFYNYRHVKNSVKDRLKKNKKIFSMLKNNPSSKLITVSDFSRMSISYNYGLSENKIDVLYSPERIITLETKVKDRGLRELLESKKRYYVLLSANRIYKNAKKTINAFKAFTETANGNDSYLVTVGYSEKSFCNHIVLQYLCESDLHYLLNGCYALLFPSLFEGFGYPPIEAMRYGKPVLCSNVTSIPEVVGDAAIMFSPFYETDIYRALLTLNDSNYKKYSEKSLKRYTEVNVKQNEDLLKLIQYLM